MILQTQDPHVYIDAQDYPTEAVDVSSRAHNRSQRPSNVLIRKMIVDRQTVAVAS